MAASRSLLVVGSCSRALQAVLQSINSNHFQKITVADLLPTYNLHQRFYKLQRRIKDKKSNINLSITKIVQIQDIAALSSTHDQVLAITHDYFSSVVSKTKIMQLTAKLIPKNKPLLCVAPVQYDHFGYTNPQQTFQQSKKKIKQIRPDTNFIRSDILDKTELYAYLSKSKNIWEDKLLQVPRSFQPKVVSLSFFANQITKVLTNSQSNIDLVIRGSKQKLPLDVDSSRQIQDHETNHLIQNIRLLVSKYKGIQDRYLPLSISP